LCVNRENGNITHPIQHWHCDSKDALADRVAEILNGNVTTIPGVYDEGGPDETDKDKNWRKQIVPADIAILSRKGAEVSKIEEALRKKGIPVSSPETSIMDKAEVKLVMALLKYVASIKRRYAKAELAKLMEDKEIGDILQEIANNRYDFNPFFDEENKDEETTDSKDTSETDAPKSKVKPKDPDAFFADLNDKLQGLRGLNISALVKGVIAVMDVRNIVAQWGNAEIRQDNLDTLIEQALSYEQATAHSADIASVAGFIQYMNDVEIKSELDQSAEGVKVATYHKSKGLQWKIVILNSLDNDELELKDFVKKNWFGLNLKGEYSNAELQLIPTCGDVSDAMAEAVEDLSKCASGMDDNGYFNMIYGKVEGEIKRLLYVGVTRARDYFVTISMPSGQAKTTQPLSWIKNILASSKPAVVVPAALDSPADPADKTDVDLWSVPSHPAYYEKLTDTGHSYSAKAITAVKLPPAAIDETTEAKTISPSSSKAQYEATPSLVKEFTSPYIDHKGIPDSAAFGTCIHNYMAAHRWEGTAKIEANKTANTDLAKQTVENHNMQKVLTDPTLLTQAADALFAYLESTFGPAKELLRECPFTYRRNNGQIVNGEMDLIWKTEKECILVDHKNFPAPAGVGKNMVLDKTNDHYVGKYFPQLGDYRAALNAAGMGVTHVFVFYAVLGCLVEVDGLEKK
jgi:ATP-dependent exoDNAse (exonuclease V) beta subunit